MTTSPTSFAEALRVIDTWEVPSAAAAVIGRRGELASGAPVVHGDPERVFALASVTKLLAAYAALVAVEEGTIALDDVAAGENITVRHLLAHAGGYGFDTGVLMPPERKRVYSNTGFEALGTYLAGQADMPVLDYVTAAVIEPLGMTSTTVTDSIAYGGQSSISDLTRFVDELLAPTLVHRSTLDDATSVQYPGLDGVLPGLGTQTPNDWGLGFELRDHKHPHWTGRSNAPATFGHFGAAGTFLWVDPTRELALVVLTDAPFGPWAIDKWPPLADAVLAVEPNA